MLHLLKTKAYWMVLCLFLIVFSVTVMASTGCPSKGEYRVLLVGAVNDYFTNPDHEKLMNLQDMLKVYATHDFSQCLAGGAGGMRVCSDGTVYGSCSVVKPLYCDFGGLVGKCGVCGCDAGFGCQADGACEQVCSDGTAYNTCSATRPLFCDNGSLVSNCQVCNCNAGYGCRADGVCVALVCADGTLYGQCSADRPLFCESGTLVNKCKACGCYEGQICKADETCLNKSEAKQAIPWMVQADKTVAEKALEAAENTPIKHPENYEPDFRQEIETAKQLLSQANAETENNEYDKAVDDYKQSWQHSQKAIEFANKEKPKEIPPIGIPGCRR